MTNATVDRGLWARTVSRTGAVAWVILALALASGAALWIADYHSFAWFSELTTSKQIDVSSFEDRFLPGSKSDPDRSGASLRHTFSSELDRKLRQARERLAQELQSEEWRSPPLKEPSPSSAAVPLPRSRPIVADLGSRSVPLSASPDSRTLFDKLSDLLPAGLSLASLPPDAGAPRDTPDLTRLGYDKQTAVYDISARAVYMPNGSKLEAHSGFGSLMDDPGRVSERNVGATPPNVYDLRPREQLFHGVPALRMIPLNGSDSLGRSGLLVHSYMLGPNGDSNGCVSIKDYVAFLRAFQSGEIKRLVVVPSLSEGLSASRRSTSPS